MLTTTGPLGMAQAGLPTGEVLSVRRLFDAPEPNQIGSDLGATRELTSFESTSVLLLGFQSTEVVSRTVESTMQKQNGWSTRGYGFRDHEYCLTDKMVAEVLLSEIISGAHLPTKFTITRGNCLWRTVLLVCDQASLQTLYSCIFDRVTSKNFRVKEC
uniref:Uncharacterized protein n=1 Tax=Ananas comosus var. bracteatus TaxID=296719 RepID=A0A6V7Q9L3_ANACO|nr:unnamed protein product [Ananas comosus var. bracteatus]